MLKFIPYTLHGCYQILEQGKYEQDIFIHQKEHRLARKYMPGGKCKEKKRVYLLANIS